ncbi:MAG TPA: carboxypeptidase regulatory-like domain-containing protein [Mycobacteriales bacterium]|nr:carboxypeptidase regulatory-like domain-containing protein [Mycobacteriales bacterium]
MLAAAPGVASASGATVSGRVADTGGTPLADVCVGLVSSAVNGTPVATARTGADGTYGVTAPAGSYYVRFADCGDRDLVTRYWPNAPYRYNATVVTLADGQQRTGVDGTMPRGGAMSGTVRNTAGEPIANASVDLRPVSDGSIPYPIDTDLRTDAQGHWLARGLPAAKYRLAFYGYNTYTGVLYGDTPDAAQSPDVEVTAGAEHTGVDATLPRPATIAGVVRDDQGNPYPKQCVRATPGTAQGSLDRYAMTGDDGSYLIDHLAIGTYRVEFSDCTGVTAATWYPNATTAGAATPIAVTEAAHVTGIDGALTPGLSITGTVRGPDGNPIAGVSAIVYDGITGMFTGRQGWTDADGHYRVTGLRGTVYKLQFGNCCQDEDLVTRWWPDAQTRETALPVSLVAGVSLTDVDMALPRGGRISGTVRDENGDPVPDVCASASHVLSGQGGAARTGLDGTYVIRALDYGSYRVSFRSCHGGNVAPAYYRGTDDPATGELVTVELEQETAGVDQVVHPGGTITGRVTDASGAPIAQVCVWPESASAHLPPTGANTDDDGRYTITGLAPHDDYRVRFSDCFVRPGRYVPVWNDGAAEYEDAPSLAVTSGTTLTADATMVRGGSASGTVYDQFGLPLYGVCVNVNATDSPSGGMWHTGQDGTFSVGGLRPGTYKALFYDCGAGVVSSVWAPGVLLESQARVFEVRAGEDTPGVDTTITVVTTPTAPVGVAVSPGDGSAKVTWQPPADDGHSPLTAFEVRNAQGTVVASTSATARTATLTGLTNGTTYSFTVNAVNAKGAGDSSAAVSVLPRPVPRLSATVPASVVSGSYSVVKGRLTTPAGAGVAGARLDLYGRRKGSTAAMVRLGGTTTTSTGTYAVTIHPPYPMEYSVRFAGMTALAPVSAARSLAVSPRVTLATSGRAVAVTVSPAAGGGTARLQAWRSTGWVNVLSAALPSTGRVAFRAPTGGLYRVVVTRTGWATGVSGSVRLA